jgi:hypothetical protein
MGIGVLNDSAIKTPKDRERRQWHPPLLCENIRSGLPIRFPYATPFIFAGMKVYDWR